MNHRLTTVAVPLAVVFGALTAHAASLQPVANWGATGVPTYVSMFIYVPDKLAVNPPVLVVSHYCGGTASGVFGEAQGGGIVAAADKYGFIMIFPQTSNNCWDVGSPQSLTHDGEGDTQAVAQMVKYTVAKYQANADRVYATGTSSGAMMTEALLAIYPDIFKAGAEFSGVPAGCWAASYSATIQWSGPCAGGQVTHTGADWSALVRAMYPGYSGYRPRIQLWHGTADAIINFNNQTEAVKEWTSVLGLNVAPTSTSTVTLNNHQWTRQTWQDSCGLAILDAWAEQNGPHGTDANLNAAYAIPFLGLDKAGPVDPVIGACPGDGGVTGAGGSRGGLGGFSGGSGGASGSGGSVGTGGNAGRSGTDGGGADGVVQGSGGARGTGGSSAGGSSGSGGASPGNTGADSGAPGAEGGVRSELSGCSCAFNGARSSAEMAAALGLTLLLLARKRRSTRP
jgi:acetylxylan esterase